MTPTLLPDPSVAVKQFASTPDEAGFVLWRDFQPRERGGVLGLIDDMLEMLVARRLRLHWVREGVTEIPLSGDEPRTYAFGFRSSVFRLVIARLAVLSDDEKTRDPIHPYRGVGSFTDPRWPHVRFEVDFDNRKDSARLDLTPVFSSEPQ